ncbi:MAG: glycosyltransferase family 4 protein [bacterium]|jgi:glycosyltransferase involved in cell wall biosynthesis
MKVLHLTGGGDIGGGKSHIIGLLHALRHELDVQLVCFLDGPVYREALERGIPTILIQQKQRYDLSVIKKLRQLIKTEGFDIIHSHGSRSNFLAAILHRNVDIPFVTTIHSDYQLDFLGNIYKQIVYTNLNKLALRYFDYYVAVSEHFRKMLIGRGFAPERVFTVYNGLDLHKPPISGQRREVFCAQLGIDLPQGASLIGTMGRLHPVKGQTVLVKAIPQVLAEFPNTRFLIAGDGEEKNSLIRLAEQLGVKEALCFSGYLHEPGNYFNAIDINVLPSNSESFPYVLLEGAWFKLPTVATAVGGIPELIKDGENGFLFPPGDSKQLAALLNKLLADPSLRQSIGEAFHKHVKDNFTTENLAKRHIEIYRAILQGTRR